jgi:hypothetical protein
LVLIRTWSRSGNVGVETVRVQKLIVAPSCNVIGGVSNQLLIVLASMVLLKFAAM